MVLWSRRTDAIQCAFACHYVETFLGAGISWWAALIWHYDFGLINLIRWCVIDSGGLECFAESKQYCSSRVKVSIIDWDAFSPLPVSEGDRAFKTAINSGWQGLSSAISWCDTRLIISLVGCDYHQKTKKQKRGVLNQDVRLDSHPLSDFPFLVFNLIKSCSDGFSQFPVMRRPLYYWHVETGLEFHLRIIVQKLHETIMHLMFTQRQVHLGAKARRQMVQKGLKSLR